MKSFLSNNNLFLSICILLYFIVFLLSSGIPFFSDVVYHAKLASLFLDNAVTYPLDNDNGNPPFYGIYLMLWWKILGKSLWVSHLAMLPVVIGISFEFFKLLKRYVPKRLIPFGLLLLLIEPTLLTQYILMGYDLFFVYLFLLGTNSILNRRYLPYCLALVILPFINLRGFSFVIALSIIHFTFLFIIEKRAINFKDLAIYLPTIFCFSLWLFYHKIKTGWFIIAPSNAIEGHHLISIKGIMWHLFYNIWYILDFGRAAIWLFIVGIIGYFQFIKKKPVFSKDLKHLAFFTFIPLFTYAVLFIGFAYFTSHRYILPVYLFATIAFIHLLQHLKKSYQYIFIAIISLLLVTGNYWIYPERLSNGWASSLKVLPYFSLKQQLVTYMQAHDIDYNDAASHFPVTLHQKDEYLTNNDFYLQDLDNLPMDKARYVVHTNVSNMFSVEEMKTLQTEWKLLKEWQKGLVYIRLYRNPRR